MGKQATCGWAREFNYAGQINPRAKHVKQAPNTGNMRTDTEPGRYELALRAGKRRPRGKRGRHAKWHQTAGNMRTATKRKRNTNWRYARGNVQVAVNHGSQGRGSAFKRGKTRKPCLLPRLIHQQVTKFQESGNYHYISLFVLTSISVLS